MSVSIAGRVFLQKKHRVFELGVLRLFGVLIHFSSVNYSVRQHCGQSFFAKKVVLFS